MSTLQASYDASTHYTRNYDLLVGYELSLGKQQNRKIYLIYQKMIVTQSILALCLILVVK